jgi:hypothetical protein
MSGRREPFTVLMTFADVMAETFSAWHQRVPARDASASAILRIVLAR